MRRILIFGGTTEGRKLAEFCNKYDIKAIVSTATPYGADLLSDFKNIETISGRLDLNQMSDYIRINNINFVIDATHPYAVEATANIKEACRICNIKYLRLLRDELEIYGKAVDSISEAVEYLNSNDKSAIITTGIKNLSEYTAVKNFRKRLAVRVLSQNDVCGLGFENVIFGNGRFSVEDNIKYIKEYNAEVLVTKESGISGGYPEKVQACRECGIDMITIKRPPESGYSLEFVKKVVYKKIFIVSTGMDGIKTLTSEALECINQSDMLIGAERVLKPFENSGKPCFKLYKTEEIYNLILESEYRKISVLMSGDCGFYSGAEKLSEKLEFFDTSIISGISSPVYFCSKINKQWKNMKFVSLHGTENNIIRNISANNYCFFLLGGKIKVCDICRKIFDYNMTGIRVYIGENLGYECERIYSGKPEDFKDLITDNLCVMITENPFYDKFIKSGISDSEFIREKIPMTKSEIRSVIISKLEIQKNSICWDIGCGTGSVSVEMALQCIDGKVYSADKNPDAIKLTGLNSKKFLCDNIEVISGNAPECLSLLPVPDKVFIGGSCGKISEIIEFVYSKNRYADIVVTAVSLETINETLRVFTNYGFLTDIVQISVTRTRKAGNHTMLSAENPIFVIKGVMP